MSDGGGSVVTLASGLEGPNLLAVDDANVYWTNVAVGSAMQSLEQAPKSGGAPITLASGLESMSIAVDSTSVYWTNCNPVRNSDGSVINNGSVMKVPIGGGSLTTLFSDLSCPGNIAVDTTNVYWTELLDGSSSYGSPPPSCQIMKVSLDGGDPIVLVTGPCGQGLAVDGTNVYWADGPLLMKISVDGGEQTTLASWSYNVDMVAVDSESLYWTDGASIAKVSIGGGVPVTLASMPNNTEFSGLPMYHVAAIVLDSTSIYWTVDGSTFGGSAAGSAAPDPAASSVMRVSKGGGCAAETLVSGLAWPYGIAVNSTSVFWTTQGDGAVMSVTPK